MRLRLLGICVGGLASIVTAANAELLVSPVVQTSQQTGSQADEASRLRALLGITPSVLPRGWAAITDILDARLCPMPVARVDTTKLVPMPTDRRASSVNRMPAARLACVNPVFSR